LLQPLIGKNGRVFGVLQLARRRLKDQPNAFSDEEARVVSLVAETVTGLVEASNTLTTLVEQREELVAAVHAYQDAMSGHQVFVDMSDQIFALAEAISASQTPLQVSEVVQSKVAGLVDAESATLFLVDGDTKELWVPGSPGSESSVSPASRSPSRSPSSVVRFPLSKGLTGAAATSGKPVVSCEVYDDPRFFPAEKLSQKLRSLLCVPVFNTAKRVVGVLQLANKSGDAGFSEADVAIIEKAA
jgi:GAF domain-containing protein